MQSSSSRSNIPVSRSNEVSCSSSNSSNSSSATFANSREKKKYIEEYNFPFCDEASKYERITKIGQGTFG